MTDLPRLEIEYRKLSELIPDPKNARTHSDEQVAKLAGIIQAFGFNNPILLDGKNGIIAGHGRLAAARKLGLDEVPTIDLGHLSETDKRAYMLADNRVALDAGWDEPLLGLELKALELEDFDLELTGFEDSEIADLLDGAGPGPEPTPDEEGLDLEEVAVTQLGDVWELGRHVVMCGSCTEEPGQLLMSDADLVCTDPPYCSGGLQEIGKTSGSVGTQKKHKPVASDNLSTRGYINLMKAGIFALRAPFFYVFTDWRMWPYLLDVAEGAGVAVRSMIAWNKGSPGMGSGWRAQHELIMWACREKPNYPKSFPARGNVISCSRSGNKLHTTEKPIDVMRELLDNTPFAKTVADPFLGSGTTLMACELEGRDCRGTELDPLYVDVIVRRWQDFTGEKAKRRGDGALFDEIAAEGAAA